MANLFEKFVTSDVSTGTSDSAPEKRSDAASTVCSKTKDKNTYERPLQTAQATDPSLRGKGESAQQAGDVAKMKVVVDPRLARRHTSAPSKTSAPSTRPKSKPQPPQSSSLSPKRIQQGFVIPKRTDKEKMFRDLDINSREYQTELYPLIKQSYRLPTSASKVVVTSVCLVRNNKLEKKYQEKKQELSQEGRSEKELGDTFAFLPTTSADMARKVCDEGVRIGNMQYCSLGKPKMGVCLQKHADVLGIKDVSSSTTMIVYKVIKGRVKAVPENSINLEPTPNYEYHVSRNMNMKPTENNLLKLASASQIYAYEYGEDGVVQKPRQLCPIAIVKYHFTDSSSGSSKAIPKQVKSSRSEPNVGVQVWTGQLFNKDTFVSDVGLLSYSILFRPTHLASSIRLNQSLPLAEFKKRYLLRAAHVTMRREMHIGRNYLLCCQLKSSGIHSFDQLVEYLENRQEAGVWYCGQRVEAYLIPCSNKSVELGFPAEPDPKKVLNCVFVSPYSLASRLAAERGRLIKKSNSGLVAGSISPSLGWSSNSSFKHPPKGLSNVDYEQGFFNDCPITSLLRYPLLKTAFEQQALGEDSQLHDKEKCTDSSASPPLSHYFRSSKHYTAYQTSRAEYTSPIHAQLSPTEIALPAASPLPHNVYDTLAMLKRNNGSDKFAFSTPGLPTTRGSCAGDRTKQLQQPANRGFQPSPSYTTTGVMHSGIPPPLSFTPSPVLEETAREFRFSGEVSPAFSDTSSHASVGNRARNNSGSSGSSVPYSPTQFSPYEEDSGENRRNLSIAQLNKMTFLTLPNCESKISHQKSRESIQKSKIMGKAGAKHKGAQPATIHLGRRTSRELSSTNVLRFEDDSVEATELPTTIQQDVRKKSNHAGNIVQDDSSQLPKRRASLPSEHEAYLPAGSGMEWKKQKRSHSVKEIPLESSLGSLTDPRMKQAQQMPPKEPEQSKLNQTQQSDGNILNETSAVTDEANNGNNASQTDIIVKEVIDKFNHNQAAVLDVFNNLPKEHQNLLWETNSQLSREQACVAGTEPVGVDANEAEQSTVHINKLSSFTMVFCDNQDLGSTAETTDQLKVNVINFTEDIMNKISKDATSPLQDQDEKHKCSRHYLSPCQDDDSSRSALELSDISTDDMVASFEGDRESNIHETKSAESSGRRLSEDDPHLSEDIDEALILDELEPLAMDMDSVYETERNSGENHNFVAASDTWKLDSVPIQEKGYDSFSDVSFDDRELISQEIFGEFITEKQVRSISPQLLSPSNDNLSVTDGTLLNMMKRFYSQLCDILHGSICNNISCYKDKLNVQNLHLSLLPIVTLKDKLTKPSPCDKMINSILGSELTRFTSLVEQVYSNPAVRILCSDLEGSSHCTNDNFVNDRLSSFNKAVDSMMERYGFDKENMKGDIDSNSLPKRLALSEFSEPNSTVDGVVQERNKDISGKLEQLLSKHEKDLKGSTEIDSASASSADDVIGELSKGENELTTSTRLIQKPKPIQFSLKTTSRWMTSKFPGRQTTAGIDLTHIPLPEECFDEKAGDGMDIDADSLETQVTSLASFIAAHTGKRMDSFPESPTEIAKEAAMSKRLQRARKLLSAQTSVLTGVPAAKTIIPVVQKEAPKLMAKRLPAARKVLRQTKKKIVLRKQKLALKKLIKDLNNKLVQRDSHRLQVRDSYLEYRKKFVQHCKVKHLPTQQPSQKKLVNVRPLLSKICKLSSTLNTGSNDQLELLLASNGIELAHLLQAAAQTIRQVATKKATISRQVSSNKSDVSVAKMKRKFSVAKSGVNSSLSQHVEAAVITNVTPILSCDINNPDPIDIPFPEEDQVPLPQSETPAVNVSSPKKVPPLKTGAVSIQTKLPVAKSVLNVPALQHVEIAPAKHVTSVVACDIPFPEEVQVSLTHPETRSIDVLPPKTVPLPKAATIPVQSNLPVTKPILNVPSLPHVEAAPVKYTTSVVPCDIPFPKEVPVPTPQPEKHLVNTLPQVCKQVLSTNTGTTSIQNKLPVANPVFGVHAFPHVEAEPVHYVTPVVPFNINPNPVDIPFPGEVRAALLPTPQLPALQPQTTRVDIWPQPPTEVCDTRIQQEPSFASKEILPVDFVAIPDFLNMVSNSAIPQIDDDEDEEVSLAKLDSSDEEEQEDGDGAVKSGGGLFYVFGHRADACNEAMQFMEKSGHRLFTLTDRTVVEAAENGAPLWIFLHVSVIPKVYLVPGLLQLKHFPNSHFLLFDDPQQLPAHSCIDLLCAGGIIVPDVSVLLKSPPGILTHVFGLMKKKRETSGPWRLLIHDHILLQLEKLREPQGIQEHSTTTARAAAIMNILTTHQREQLVEFMYPHPCDVEGNMQPLCLTKIQEEYYKSHRHVVLVSELDVHRSPAFQVTAVKTLTMIELINTYLL